MSDKEKKIIDQKSLIKSKTLHELLKQGGGQNLVIDFSMLSKKGKLNGLIEKAKKYKDSNNPKLSEEPINDKKKDMENEEKIYKKSKISKNFEILTKFSNRINNKNSDIDNKIKNKEINYVNSDKNIKKK
jgi:hypothetical protein